MKSKYAMFFSYMTMWTDKLLWKKLQVGVVEEEEPIASALSRGMQVLLGYNDDVPSHLDMGKPSTSCQELNGSSTIPEFLERAD